MWAERGCGDRAIGRGESSGDDVSVFGGKKRRQDGRTDGRTYLGGRLRVEKSESQETDVGVDGVDMGELHGMEMGVAWGGGGAFDVGEWRTCERRAGGGGSRHSTEEVG